MSNESRFTDIFCKHYKNIHLTKDSAFQERMQFDIYKRSTRMQRFEILLDAQKKRLPKYEIEATFKRLIKDGERRILHSKQNIQEKKEEKVIRKVTIDESNKIYDQFMQKRKQIEKNINKDYQNEIQ